MDLSRFSTCLICSALALSLGAANGFADPPAMPPSVSVCLPVERVVAADEEFRGRLDAASKVDLKARVSGYLAIARCQNGEAVKAGQLLFEIDSRSFQAELARAEADLSLKEARLKLAQTNFDRASALAKTPGAVSREELDKAAGDRDAATASLQAARVARDGARNALEATKITAPIEGRIGGGLLNVGNLVKADDTTLGTIVDVKRMHVQFDVDERTYLRLSRAMKAGKQKLAVSIGLVDEEGFPREATIDFIDNRVIEKTNTIRFRALLRDSDELLLSGMSCRVRMTMGEPYRAMLIPERAIRDVDGAKALYVVNENNKVELRRVEIGLRQADGLWVVRNGLKAGEKIVLGGFDRLQPGTIVNATLVQEPHSGSESK